MEIKNAFDLGKYFTFDEAKKEPVYNWFYYKEGFSPELIRILIDRNKPKHIFDPFCGSGTTLLASKEKGIPSLGIDASPLAVFISYVKTRNYSFNEDILEYFNPLPEPNFNWSFDLIPLKKIFPPRNLKEILAIRTAIEKIPKEDEKNFSLLALISILPMVSFIKKDGGFLRIVKKPLPSAKTLFKRKLKKMVKEKISGPEPEVLQEDARNFKTKTSLIITSPPYLNNVDYSKIYGLELSLLGYKEPDLLTSFIKKNKKPIFVEEVGDLSVKIPIVGHYFYEMKQVLKNSFDSLNKGGKAYFVVGNSVIQRQHIFVDEILAKIGENLGFSSKILIGKKRIADVKPHKVMTRESMIVFEK